MMDPMFTQTGSRGIHHITTLIEGWSLHAALYAFNEPDVFGLQYVIDESDGLHFSIGGCVGFKKEIKFLIGLFRINGNNASHHEVTPAGVTHQGHIGPKIPDRMVGHTHIVDTIGLVFRTAGFGHMTGIDAVGFDFVGIHLY